MSPKFSIQGRMIGPDYPPLVIAEIGINHEGDLNKALKMVQDAKVAGCECVKFQYHIIEDEMIPNDVVPGNADESIWNIMQRCSLSIDEEQELKRYVDSCGLLYLSTPFSRAASNELNKLAVDWYKIGSGECNNYPLVKHIASFGRPVVVSTGMNDLQSIEPTVNILRDSGVPFALMHCTSLYPTPYDKVRLGGITELSNAYPDAVMGLSDHSLGPYTCFAAIPLGASILEKHFTSDISWPGPDIPISLDPLQLSDMVSGCFAIFQSLGGSKSILPEEQPTIDFAYACVVTTRPVLQGEFFGQDNLWVKRPGTGSIKAKDFESLLGKRAVRNLPTNYQVELTDIEN